MVIVIQITQPMEYLNTVKKVITSFSVVQIQNIVFRDYLIDHTKIYLDLLNENTKNFFHPKQRFIAKEESRENLKMNMFDERASQWDSDPAKVERAKLLAELIKKQLSTTPIEKALEYGCGTGLLSFALKDEFTSIDLVDSSLGMLEVLKEKINSSKIANMNPRLLDLIHEDSPNTNFGIIYSLLTLHHIPETKTILEKFFKILQPGGLLCLSDLDKEDGTFHPAGTKDILYGFDRKEVIDLAENAGFENISCCDAMKITKSTAGQEKTFPLFLLTARKPF